MGKSLKSILGRKEISIGSWITVANTSIVEVMAGSGFDWLTIDMEHSAISIDQCQELIRVIDLCAIAPLVRVGANDALLIKHAMDAGAHGVIVPMVNTREDAQKAVNAVKYPPQGIRGVGLGRAQGYGLGFEKYKKWVNANSILIVQIEHIKAIDNLEEILQVKGVDASIIGPYDLSASMGYPGEFEKIEVKKMIKKYTDICNKLKKPSGFHVIDPKAEKLKEKIKEGFKFIAFSLDTLFLGIKCRQELEKLGKK